MRDESAHKQLNLRYKHILIDDLMIFTANTLFHCTVLFGQLC